MLNKKTYRYAQEDEDDDLEPYPGIYPNFSRGKAATSQPNYYYVNSERDFTLPLQKHRNIQTPYESPDEGYFRLYL